MPRGAAGGRPRALQLCGELNHAAGTLAACFWPRKRRPPALSEPCDFGLHGSLSAGAMPRLFFTVRRDGHSDAAHRRLPDLSEISSKAPRVRAISAAIQLFDHEVKL